MIDNGTDTIAAICTGMTAAGINIIRISGDKAFDIAGKVFRSIKNKSIEEMSTFSVNYGYIVDNVGNVDNIIDEVLLLKMQAPHSYTKEDVIEIDCHGGITVTKRILDTVLSNGARLAEPGEFTKRAFLNGRIDLSQAEAVIDIINAKSNLALKNSVKQLKGQIKEKIVGLRDRLISKTAYIEAALDDPEHISLDGFTEELASETKDICKELSRLIASADEGRFLNEGINTCILGLPNAGKSSLLNTLLMEERAIVTDIAGTTRDVLKETAVFGDVVLNIIDTAGIRETRDIIEKIGVDKAKKEAEEADLILYVIDMNEGIDETDISIIKSFEDKNIIIVFNKLDLLPYTGKEDTSLNINDYVYCGTEEKRELLEKYKYVIISSLTGFGIEELKNMIKEMFYTGSINNNEDIIITNERHRRLLIDAKNSVEKVIEGIEEGFGEDFLTIDLMDAYEALGKIIGESVEDDLADRIFRDFCMGK